MKEIQVEGKGSTSARISAAYRAWESAKNLKERLFCDPYAAYLAGPDGIEAANRWTALWPTRPWLLALRTRYIDDWLIEGTSRGIRQVVLHGAGYDTRALRVEALRGLTIFEVDEATTSLDKQARLGQREGGLPRNVTYLQHNLLGEPLGELELKLRAGGFRPALPSYWIAEGLLPYLRREVIEELFRWMASQMPPGSGLVFDYFHRAACPPSYLATFRQRVEPLDANSQWTPDLIEALLVNRCLGKVVHRSIDEIKQIYRPQLSETILPGYNLVIAERVGSVPL